ncbi:MAG: hypothetical protein AAF998_11455 [Bacteroidota bacterium]
MAKLKEKYDFNALVSEEELALRLEAGLAVSKLENHQTFHFKMSDEFKDGMTWKEYWAHQEKRFRERFETKRKSIIAGIAVRRIKENPEIAEKHRLAK